MCASLQHTDVQLQQSESASSLVACNNSPYQPRTSSWTDVRDSDHALRRGAGAQPLWLPTIATVGLEESEHLALLDEALAELPAFRHVAFTSRTGIEALVARLATIQ